MCALTFPVMKKGDWDLEIIINQENEEIDLDMPKEYREYKAKVEVRRRVAEVLTDTFIDNQILYLKKSSVSRKICIFCSL